MTIFKSVIYVPAGNSVPVTIEYTDEGSGNVIVMLPSLARSGPTPFKNSIGVARNDLFGDCI